MASNENIEYTSMGEIGKGLEYVKSIPFVLKISEIIVLLIAFSLAGHFLNEIHDSFFAYYGKKGNIDFFLFATIVGWLIAIAFLIFFAIGIHEMISALPWTLVAAIVSAVWTILLLISSALLAAAAKHYDDDIKIFGVSINISVCESLDHGNHDAQCWQLIAGAIVGFIATVLHAVDAVIHTHMFLTRGSIPQAVTIGAAPA